MLTLDELQQAQAEVDENTIAEIRYELRQNLYQFVVDWASQISDTLGMAAYSAVNGRWDDIPRDIARGRITAAEAISLLDKMVECQLITGQQYEWYKQKFSYSILEAPCICSDCGWSGTVYDCEPDVDGEGSLGCPKCETILPLCQPSS